MYKIFILISLVISSFTHAQIIDETTYKKVWESYLKEIRANSKRLEEHKQKKLSFKDKTMRYDAKKVGEAGEKGYPLYIALHGGGGGPARMNDSQWKHMKVYYHKSVKRGIYVAPRGVTNTWNLHFVDESYQLYDRLIENMIAYENVDPNQVYIMGFSAGGDGTYAISCRMSDRWAAAAMSAGHHNGLDPRNLFNLPILLQVGDNDKAYKRHLVTVDFAQKLLDYSKQENGGYIHDINVHFKRGHNFLDNHPKELKQKVIANPFEWKNGKAAKVKEINTNSVSWLSQFSRKPLPEKIIWNTKIKAPRAAANRHYWLGVSKETKEEVIASINKKENSVKIEKAVDGLLVLLNHQMLNLNKEVTFEIDGKKYLLKPKLSLKNMEETLRERGDKNYIFPVKVELKKTDHNWELKSL